MKKREFEDVIERVVEHCSSIPLKKIIKRPYHWMQIIRSHIEDFDPKTKCFLSHKLDEKTLNDYLLEKYDKLRILFISEECLMSVRDSVNFHNGIIPMGMGFYNYIIINSSRITKERLLEYSDEFMGLIGHETIHTIQSDCFSSLYEFKCAYLEQKKIHNNSYTENPYEMAAFRFGGYKKRSDIKQYFNQIEGWWK